MGFLGKILGSKPDQPKVERLDFSQLPQWLEARKSELGQGLDQKAAPITARVHANLEQINTALGELAVAGMQKEVPDRVKSVVSSSRDNYVAKVKKIISEINAKQNAIELSESLKSALEAITKVDARYGGRANFGFPSGVAKLKKCFNSLVETYGALETMIKDRKVKLKIVKEAESILKELNKTADEIKALEGRGKEASSSSHEAERGLEERESEIERVEGSEKAKKVAEMKDAAAELKARKQEIESMLLNMLGPLGRIFKKYAKAAAEGKVPMMTANKYSEEPVETYLRGDNTLPELLAKMQMALQTNTIRMDSVEEEKMLKKIRAISFSYIDQFRNEHKDIVSKVRTLEVQIAEMDVSKDVEKLERERQSLASTKEEHSKSAAKIDEDMGEKKAALAELHKQLAEKLSEFICGKCEITGQ